MLRHPVVKLDSKPMPSDFLSVIPHIVGPPSHAAYEHFIKLIRKVGGLMIVLFAGFL